MGDGEPETDLSEIEFDHEELRVFWDLARFHAKLNAAPSYFGPTTLESVPPPAWSFGETPAQSDEFARRFSRTSPARPPLPLRTTPATSPRPGCSPSCATASGKPRALVEVTEVAVGADEVVEAFRVVYQA